MTTTYTPNSSLRKPASSDRTWDVPLNANTDILDGVSAIGSLCVATAETPSTTLNVKVSAGSFRKSDGTVVTYAGTSSQVCTASSTNYLYLTNTGTLTVNTTGFPAATDLVPLATVAAGTTTITSVTDARRPFVSFGASIGTGPFLPLAGGTLTDGANVAVGTTTGTKLGTATSQKIGLWNATPVIQPASANQAAIGTFTTVTLTDSTGGTPSTTLAAATNTASLTDSTGGTPSTTLAAISDTATKNAIASLAAQLATQRTLNTLIINWVASLAAQVNHTVTDEATIKTLVNQIRSDLVTIGALKGSA